MELDEKNRVILNKFNNQDYVDDDRFMDRVNYIIKNVHMLSHNRHNKDIIQLIHDTNIVDGGKYLFNKLPNSYIFYNKILTPGCFSINDLNLLDLLKRLKYSFNKELDYDMVNFLGQELYKLTDKCKIQQFINEFLTYTNSHMSELITSFITKNPIIFTSNMLDRCYKNQPYMWKVLDYLLSTKHVITLQQFFLIPDYETMKKASQYLKINITEDNFIDFLKHYTILSPQTLKEMYKISPKINIYDSYTFNKRFVHSYTDEKFELFVTMGLQITQKSILEAINHKIMLPNIERFNIELNVQEIIQKCDDKGYYPNYSFINTTPELIELRNLSTSTNTKELKLFFKKNPNIKPDSICIKNAGQITQGTAFQVLLENGGIVTLDILNCVVHTKTYDARVNFTKNCQKLIYNQIKLLESLSTNANNEIIKKSISELQELFSMNSYENDPKDDVVEENMEEIMEENMEEIIEEKVPKTRKRKAKK